ncbi:protein of unknown function [Thermococcus nautili]|uniref:hypothetical protein n=1 Tax=Thermococcus nautili TaxID=195522 RepID=UPI002555117E|nr:hypothetical protein [Thermococcus nautili]CAI1492368.1 protein of unknown function [Thermococcus nautili]
MEEPLQFSQEDIEHVRKKLLQKRREFIEKFAKDVLGLEIKIRRGEKKKIVEELMQEHQDEILKFFLIYLPEMGGKDISINRARHALATMFPNFASEINAIKSKEEVLLFLYRHVGQEKLQDYLPWIRYEAYIEKNREKNRYLLEKPFLFRDNKELERLIDEFMKEWNSKNVHWARIDMRSTRDGEVKLIIKMEYGRRHYQEFSIRQKMKIYKIEIAKISEYSKDNHLVNTPIAPKNREDLREVSEWIYPIGHYILQIRPVDDKKTEIILGFDLNKKYPRDLVDRLLSVLFGEDTSVNDLKLIKPQPVEELKETVKQTIQHSKHMSDAIEQIDNKIKERKSEAVQKLQSLNLPDEAKEKLNEIIESIKLGGFRFPGDPATGALKVDIVADLDEFRRIVPNVDDFLDDLIEAYGDKVEPVLLVNNKPVNLASENVYSRLKEEERLALKLFLGDINESE